MILINNTAIEKDDFSEQIFENSLSIYEVVRVFKGRPIFLSDNLQRLDNSLKKSNIHMNVKSLNIPEKLKHFIDLSHITEGNLKYVLHFKQAQPDEYIFQIPHSYPTARDYEQGVATMTYPAVRENPEIKYINADLRTLANRLMHDNQVYEILLVDRNGFITEGSRSNVFFIKGNVLYTAPVEYVLPGTSRKRVIEICKICQCPVEEKQIALSGLSGYDAAFLSGTSPLILPIHRIDNLYLDPKNQLLQKLMKQYFTLLQNS